MRLIQDQALSSLLVMMPYSVRHQPTRYAGYGILVIIGVSLEDQPFESYLD